MSRTVTLIEDNANSTINEEFIISVGQNDFLSTILFLSKNSLFLPPT
jgi:hypothetical protein